MFHKIWVAREREAMNKATSLHDLAEIAIRALQFIHQTCDGEIVQICGPMSTGGLGNLKNNMDRFDFAVMKAEEMGVIVFNQAHFQDAMIRVIRFKEGQPYCVDLLEVFYRRVFESGFISRTLFLPDWSTSVGAIWEREVAQSLGIAVEEYPLHWLKDFVIVNKKGGEQ